MVPKPTFRVMVFTEIQYYDNGTAKVVRSFSKPVGMDKYKKKKVKKELSPVKDAGQVEL